MRCEHISSSFKSKDLVDTDQIGTEGGPCNMGAMW